MRIPYKTGNFRSIHFGSIIQLTPLPEINWDLVINATSNQFHRYKLQIKLCTLCLLIDFVVTRNGKKPPQKPTRMLVVFHSKCFEYVTTDILTEQNTCQTC